MPRFYRRAGVFLCSLLSGGPAMPSGTIPSGKSLQNKSQFRTIAPKIVPKVLPSHLLPGHVPSLSDQVHSGPSISPTTQGMPAQNYALMQVAGQEGTFSLVALPHVASAQPAQKHGLALPDNLKLPIPRYQSPRSNKGLMKSPVLSASESGCSKPPAQTQVSPAFPDHSEPLSQPSPSEPMTSLDQGHGSVSMAALTSGGGPGDSQPPVTIGRGDSNLPDTPTSSTPEEPGAMQGLVKTSGTENVASKETARKPSVASSEKQKEQVDLARGPIRWPPAFVGSALQLVPSITKCQLPTMPYSKTTTEVHESESDANTVDIPLSGLRGACDKTPTVAEGWDAAAKMAATVPQVPKQGARDSAFCPATKVDLHRKTKLNGGAAKRKGRKLKVPDEILSFQGKRRKCKRIKNDPQQSRDQKPGALKKYRSIMPKPVIAVPTVAPLASPAAVLQPQRPSSLGQSILLSNSLTPKYLSCKQDASPFPKPGSTFRNGFSGSKKSWHRCPVCSHHFQFKQHLRDHMNTHSDRRPYSCRVCRKAYVRSSGLSTHMALHHGESRLKKLVCCEFCAKVFGHVRVYFGHLKEVHRVVISTEPSPSELLPGDMPKSRDTNVPRENKSSLEEDLLLNQADEVKLQIKCGRCQITAQSFAEIKFHLLYAHGEEIQGRLQEETSPGSQAAPEEWAQHGAPSWKRPPERRKPLRCCPTVEEPHVVPKWKGQLRPPHQSTGEGAQPGPRELGEGPQGPRRPSPHSVLLPPRSGFRCVLCAQTLGTKEDVLLHWAQGHSCEDLPGLWRVLGELSTQGAAQLASPGETETLGLAGGC
ncbi:zinc finger protein 438 isoform X1 [Saccopteryx bilineata]|uniref:zinc finger protein 438 isoform X1 n=2 Tax=Saccopteryx bilineata TaxID=59482 RepID=UPI00338FAF39